MIITDEQIEEAFKGTRFGLIDNDVFAQRDYIAKAIMKSAFGYANGSTMQGILQHLGTVKVGKKTKPSKEAMKWAYARLIR